MTKELKWIGFDLDGTLAQTTVRNAIGSLIKLVVDLLLKIYHEGKYRNHGVNKNQRRTGKRDNNYS